jgi:hypothetical protein
MVGDRGMITRARIEGDLVPTGLDWIAALRAPAIQHLVAEGGPLQMSLFDERDLAEIESPDFERLRRAHSIAFWDNRCTHHKAVWDNWPNVRSGYRIQIEGTGVPGFNPRPAHVSAGFSGLRYLSTPRPAPARLRRTSAQKLPLSRHRLRPPRCPVFHPRL